MRNQRHHNQKEKIEIWSKNPSEFHGTIERTPFNQRQFGNWGVVQYSVLGKRYDSVGGRELTLPHDVIQKLKIKGELK
jgi:hypothetical protein